MNEKELAQLINDLDDDLFCQGLDQLMDDHDMDIDIETITQKARWKLRKEEKKMRMKKAMPIIAASLVIVCGVTMVYGAELSAFVKSLLNKTGIYATVTDGPAYYLPTPLTLGENQRLEKAMFTAKQLELQVIDGVKGTAKVNIRIDGKEMEPHGFSLDGDTAQRLIFYDLIPTDTFDLIIDGKSYPIKLAAGDAVTKSGELIEAEPNGMEGIFMGYKKITNGIQIVTTVENRDFQLYSLMLPKGDKVTANFGPTGMHQQTEELMPLTGQSKDGSSYAYHYNAYDMGRPFTQFTSDVSAGQDITLKIPGVVISHEKSQTDLTVPLPNKGERKSIQQEIDFSLQKMLLQEVERTSDTTARLTFKLNTGEREKVKIWTAIIDSQSVEKGELLWQNGTCIMDVTFAKNTTEIDLSIASPLLIVSGDWTMMIR